MPRTIALDARCSAGRSSLRRPSATPRRRGPCRRRASGVHSGWASGQSAGPTREQGLVAPGGGCRGLSRSRVRIGDPTTQSHPVDSERGDRRDPGCRAPRPAGGLAGAAAVRGSHSCFRRRLRQGTPRREAGIQAHITPGSRCWVVEGTRSIKKDLSEPSDHHGVPAFGGLDTGLRADRSSLFCAPWPVLVAHWTASCSDATAHRRMARGELRDRPGAFGNCPMRVWAGRKKSPLDVAPAPTAS
jgi:hypothetical protein